MNACKFMFEHKDAIFIDFHGEEIRNLHTPT